MKKTKSKKIGRKEWLLILSFFALSIALIVFGVLCISNAKQSFWQRYHVLFSILYGLLIVVACVCSVVFVIKKKETLTKTILSGYVFLLFCLILVYIFQRTGFFELVKTPTSLQAYLEGAGAWMPIAYILLQFLQVVLLPIPSFVSTVAGVALFGAFWTTLYSLIGIIAGSFLAFFIGRKVGNRAVAWIVGEDVLNKWQKKLKGKDNLILTIMFILPLFPDDVLCFVAGLSSMTTKYFIIMVVIARVLGIAGTCFSVDFIPFNTWWGLLLWGTFFAFVVAAFVFVYKNMDKIQSRINMRKKKMNTKK